MSNDTWEFSKPLVQFHLRGVNYNFNIVLWNDYRQMFKSTNVIKKNQKYPGFLEVLQINLSFMFIIKIVLSYTGYSKKKAAWTE